MAPNKKKSRNTKLRQKHVKWVMAMQARRELVVLLGSLIVVLAPLYPAAIVYSKINIANDPLDLTLIEAAIYTAIFLFVFIFFVLIASIPWTIFLSYFLTMDEYKGLMKIPTPNMPIATPFLMKLTTLLLKLKEKREAGK